MSLPFPSWERAFQPKEGCKIGRCRSHCYGAAETSVAETQRKEAGTDICFRTRFAHPSQDRSPPRGRGDRAGFVALLRADSSVSPRWLRRASPRRLCCFSAPALLLLRADSAALLRSDSAPCDGEPSCSSCLSCTSCFRSLRWLRSGGFSVEKRNGVAPLAETSVEAKFV